MALPETVRVSFIDCALSTLYSEKWKTKNFKHMMKNLPADFHQRFSLSAEISQNYTGNKCPSHYLIDDKGEGLKAPVVIDSNLQLVSPEYGLVDSELMIKYQTSYAAELKRLKHPCFKEMEDSASFASL